jgi:hypothetical protein
MKYATYTFAMSGKSKYVQYEKIVGLFNKETINLVVPDVELTQTIQNVFNISVVTEPGTITIVNDLPQVYGQVVRDFDVITYVDPRNNRNMSMLYTGDCFVGYFSMPELGDDEWSQSLLNELLEKGLTVCEVPTAFSGVIA